MFLTNEQIKDFLSNYICHRLSLTLYASDTLLWMALFTLIHLSEYSSIIEKTIILSINYVNNCIQTNANISIMNKKCLFMILRIWFYLLEVNNSLENIMMTLNININSYS